MNDKISKKYESVAEGSIWDTANSRGEKAEEVVANADVVVMLDVSSSMGGRLGDGKTRYDVAVEQLRNIQRTFPGRVVLIEFGMKTQIKLDGLPSNPAGSTPMDDALNLAYDFDGMGTKFYLISDGEPYPFSRTQAVYDWAASFKDPIHTIFIGDDSDKAGIEVMEKVSNLSGGTSSGKIEPDQLAGRITKLLTGGV